MGDKKNLRIADEYGANLVLFRPRKNAGDETLHLEIENTDYLGNPNVTCVNLDFIDASELADALVRFSRRLKIDFPPVEEPDPVQASCTVDNCICKTDKVNPDGTYVRPYWAEPWGTGWYNVPQTINTSDGNVTVTDVLYNKG